jgi:hypothetical protein
VKQGEALLLLLFNFAVEGVIRRPKKARWFGTEGDNISL